jgi:hypothetical protein
MKNKLYLILFLLLTFIIIPGCGGDDNVTQTSLIATPSATGYLTITIVWPQAGKEGKCTISSADNQQNLTASMTDDTDYVTIKVRDKNKADHPEDYFPTGGYYIFAREPGEKSITKTLGPIPATDVIVRAVSEAHSSITGISSLISVTEHEFRIKPGTQGNSISLNLGDYKLKVEPAKKTIVIGETIAITATLTIEDSPGHSVAAEGALNEKDIEFTISGKKTIVKTDKNGKAITNVMGEQVGPMPIVAEFKPIPQETIRAENSVDVTGPVGRYVLTVNSNTDRIFLRHIFDNAKTSSIQANAIPQPTGEAAITANLVYIGPSQQGEPTPIPLPVEGKEIEFTATTGNMEPLTAITDGEGNCTAKFLATDIGTVTIKGVLKDDPGNTGQCSIQVDRDYYLSLQGNSIDLIPDFKTVDNIQLSKKVSILACLKKPDNDTGQSLIPAEGVTLNFTLDGYGTLNVINNGITNENGCAMAEVDYSGYTGGPTDSTVTVSFNNLLNPDYSSETCNSGYYMNKKYADTFENYPVNTYASDLSLLPYSYGHVTWSAGGEALNASRLKNIIDSPGADNTDKSIKLYSDSSLSYVEAGVFNYYNTMTREFRFYIRIGNKTNNGLSGTASIDFVDMSAEGSIGIKFLNFKDDIEKGKKIYDAKGEEITAFYPTDWYPVRIQILGTQYDTPQTLKVNYWFGEEFKKSIYLENVTCRIDSEGHRTSVLSLSSKNNTVWFDQIEYYYDFYDRIP